MTDVTRIGGGGPTVTTPPKPPPRRPSRPAKFTVEISGETIAGSAISERRETLKDLRRGRWPLEAEVDLHGHSRETARLALLQFLVESQAAEHHCVLVVHGRGLRSADGPQLKTALPAWLAEQPHGSQVRAFATAPPRLGGPGATLVLLRVARR